MKKMEKINKKLIEQDIEKLCVKLDKLFTLEQTVSANIKKLMHKITMKTMLLDKEE